MNSKIESEKIPDETNRSNNGKIDSGSRQLLQMVYVCHR